MNDALTGNTLNIKSGAVVSRREGTALAGCLAVSVSVCVAQIIGNRMLIFAVLAGFLAFAAWACMRDMAFHTLLYFLPWSPLLRLYRGSISFFTIGVLAICLICLLKKRLSMSLYQIITASSVLLITLVAKTLNGHHISNEYIYFIAVLLLFPCVVRGCGRRLSFDALTLFFSCGIIVAALSARQVIGFQNISQYIRVDSYLKITRLSGYYSDPNFYSAQITACLAGVLLILCREKERMRRLLWAVVTVLLIYCGLLSASKSFVLVTACLFFAWIPVLMEKRNRGSGRVRLLVGVLCAAVVVLSSSAFKQLWAIIDTRFAYASNLSELTTGRTELWLSYLREFRSNWLLTLLGEGYTSVTLNGKASHNTIIQAVYQFGIVGLPFVAAWLWRTVRDAFGFYGSAKPDLRIAAMLCIGVAMPWMGIDLLFFDEFFILPVYAAVGLAYSLDIPSADVAEK